MAKQDKSTRNKLKKRRFYKRKGFWLSLIGFSVIFSIIGYFGFDRYAEKYRQQAAQYDLDHINDLEIPSVILDRNNQEIGRVYVQNRSVIPLDQVPKIFIDALRAGEDQRFWDHDGVDYIGIVRAAKLNFTSGHQNQGASTLTQQLARNAFPVKQDAKQLNQSGIERKLVEAFLAHRIEKRYSKKEILEFYLNRIYFGSGFYGIRSASLGYFGKEPADLTAAESAAIVGAIKNPLSMSPLNNPEASRKSRNLVLGRMPDLGDSISKEDAERFMKEPVVTHPRPLQRGTSHLYERIADEIRANLGEDALVAGGFLIHTSVDGRVQKSLENALELSYQKAERAPGYANQKKAAYRKTETSTPEYLQGAALMVDHGTGEVIGYVGGRSYVDAPFDVIESGRRPLGTAFFPFVYAAGLKQHTITPALTMQDFWLNNREVMVGATEGVLAEWGMETPTPTYTKKNITMRQALAWSKTSATVRFANVFGLDKIAKTSAEFGFQTDRAEPLPRLALGWESASMKEAVRGISAFARGGQTSPKQLTIVNRIDNADGHIVYERPRRLAERLEPIDDATAFQVHDMMRSGMEYGPAAGLADQLIEKPFTGAGKTGSTVDFSDTWFLGYNGRVSCGVWLGFLQPGKKIYEGAFSKDLAMPVWVAGMNAAATDFGGKVIAQPESIEQVAICSVTGQRATPHCEVVEEDPVTGKTHSHPSAQMEFFRAGTAKNLPFCQLHSGAAIEPPTTQIGLSNLSAIDTTPVRSKSPVLLGDDPYHTEQTLAEVRQRPVSSSTNVLDSFELGDDEKPVKLPWPKRVEINPETN